MGAKKPPRGRLVGLGEMGLAAHGHALPAFALHTGLKDDYGSLQARSGHLEGLSLALARVHVIAFLGGFPVLPNVLRLRGNAAGQ
jgi:hypothetical protein